MQGYIENDLSTFEAKKALAEEKAKEIALQYGYHLDENGNIIGKDLQGNDKPGSQPTTALFEINKSLVNDDYYAFSIRDVFPTTYQAIEDHAGLVLVDIPNEYFTVPEV